MPFPSVVVEVKTLVSLVSSQISEQFKDASAEGRDSNLDKALDTAMKGFIDMDNKAIKSLKNNDEANKLGKSIIDKFKNKEVSRVDDSIVKELFANPYYNNLADHIAMRMYLYSHRKTGHKGHQVVVKKALAYMELLHNVIIKSNNPDMCINAVIALSELSDAYYDFANNVGKTDIKIKGKGILRSSTASNLYLSKVHRYFITKKNNVTRDQINKIDKYREKMTDCDNYEYVTNIEYPQRASNVNSNEKTKNKSTKDKNRLVQIGTMSESGKIDKELPEKRILAAKKLGMKAWIEGDKYTLDIYIVNELIDSSDWFASCIKKSENTKSYKVEKIQSDSANTRVPSKDSIKNHIKSLESVYAGNCYHLQQTEWYIKEAFFKSRYIDSSVQKVKNGQFVELPTFSKLTDSQRLAFKYRYKKYNMQKLRLLNILEAKPYYEAYLDTENLGIKGAKHLNTINSLIVISILQELESKGVNLNINSDNKCIFISYSNTIGHLLKYSEDYRGYVLKNLKDIDFFNAFIVYVEKSKNLKDKAQKKKELQKCFSNPKKYISDWNKSQSLYKLLESNNYSESHIKKVFEQKKLVSNLSSDNGPTFINYINADKELKSKKEELLKQWGVSTKSLEIAAKIIGSSNQPDYKNKLLLNCGVTNQLISKLLLEEQKGNSELDKAIEQVINVNNDKLYDLYLAECENKNKNKNKNNRDSWKQKEVVEAYGNEQTKKALTHQEWNEIEKKHSKNTLEEKFQSFKSVLESEDISEGARKNIFASDKNYKLYKELQGKKNKYSDKDINEIFKNEDLVNNLSSDNGQKFINYIKKNQDLKSKKTELLEKWGASTENLKTAVEIIDSKLKRDVKNNLLSNFDVTAWTQKFKSVLESEDISEGARKNIFASDKNYKLYKELQGKKNKYSDKDINEIFKNEDLVNNLSSDNGQKFINYIKKNQDLKSKKAELLEKWGASTENLKTAVEIIDSKLKQDVKNNLLSNFDITAWTQKFKSVLESEDISEGARKNIFASDKNYKLYKELQGKKNKYSDKDINEIFKNEDLVNNLSSDNGQKFINYIKKNQDLKSKKTELLEKWGASKGSLNSAVEIIESKLKPVIKSKLLLSREFGKKSTLDLDNSKNNQYNKHSSAKSNVLTEQERAYFYCEIIINTDKNNKKLLNKLKTKINRDDLFRQLIIEKFEARELKINYLHTLSERQNSLHEVNKYQRLLEVYSKNKFERGSTKSTAVTEYTTSVNEAKKNYLLTGKTKKLKELKNNLKIQKNFKALEEHSSHIITRILGFLSSAITTLILAPFGGLVASGIQVAEDRGNYFFYKHHTDSSNLACKVEKEIDILGMK